MSYLNSPLSAYAHSGLPGAAVASALINSPKTLSTLKWAADALWKHRDLMSGTPKKLIAHHQKGQVRRKLPSQMPGSSSLIYAPATMGLQQHSGTFLKMFASNDGNSAMIVGSQMMGVLGRYNSGGANTALFMGPNETLSGSCSRRHYGRLLNPSFLTLSGSNDSTPGTSRLNSFNTLFDYFRFHHVHMRYVPTLNPIDARHGTILWGYSAEPAILDDETVNATTGILGFSQVAANFIPTVSSPSWAPFDLELNFAPGQWFHTDPEGGNIGTTADDFVSNVRQACQGGVFGCWVDVSNPSSEDAIAVGYVFVDFAVEFTAPSVQAIDAFELSSLTKQQRLDLGHLLQSGWKPPSTETAKPDQMPSAPMLHDRASVRVGLPRQIK